MAHAGTSSSTCRAHKWLFSRQEMLNARTIKEENWDYEKELDYRQKMTRCIQDMVDQLNDQTKDKAQKVTQLCMCAASIHMHRFYYFHSFVTFDFQDVAAACLFLAGKSEESPRKLDHIVHVWWAKKFPKYRKFPPNNPQIYNDAKAYIVQLENIVLQTIAFDLKIDLPHPIVLTLTSKNIGQVYNDHGNKRLTECAYFFATDVLCVTNWAIRYSALEIAVCCVDIVCHFAKHEIPKRPDGLAWYTGIIELSSEKLEAMQKEFLDIYQKCKYKLAIHKFHHSKPLSQLTEKCPENMKEVVPPLLPPPPVPPVMNKITLSEYKERNKLAGIESPSEKQRKAELASHNSVTIGLPQIHLPGITNIPNSNHDRSRDEKKEEDRRREKERRREEKRKEERPEERDRRKEEERRRREDEKRKREHSKSGSNNDEAKPFKKFRTDIKQSFVPASNNYAMSNGNHKEYRATIPLATIKPPPPPISPPSMGRYLQGPYNIPKNELEKEEGEL